MKSAQATTTIRHHRNHLSQGSQRAAADSQSRAARLVQRVGFTLVELLMVILIIGILVSMLAVAINPVLTTSREFAVTQEMKQMDLAIENFQNKYGFYPPSFQGLNVATDVLPYLNKLSANHRENSTPMFPASGPVSASSPSRLVVWWNAIGRHLDDRGSLIFWLSGLSANKQFPITGNLPLDPVTGNAQLPVIFNTDLVIQVDSSDINNAVVIDGENEFQFTALEREAQFDFRGAQLSSDLPGGGTAPAGIRIYNSPYGNAKGDLAYRYRNSAFYGTAPIAFHVNTDSDPVFPNPRTFQISTLGLDGELSSFASTAINQPLPNRPDMPTVEQLTEWQSLNADNIANFANGRLDAFDWTEAVDIGNRTPQ